MDNSWLKTWNYLVATQGTEKEDVERTIECRTCKKVIAFQNSGRALHFLARHTGHKIRMRPSYAPRA